MKIYFKKESLRNRIIGSDKQPIAWEPVGNDCGVKEVDTESDKQTSVQLEDLAAKRRMGVVRISPEIYASLKKNPSPPRQSPSPLSVGQSIRVFDRESTLPKPSQVGGAVPAAKNVETAKQPAPSAPGTAPISAKERLFSPKTRKASVVAEIVKQS